MSFSRKQQILFRPLMAAAWKLTHPGQPWKSSDYTCRNWYEDELYLACGKVSSLDCDPRRDFEKVMAHFESAAGGSLGRNPFYWNFRINGGDARRIIHEVQSIAQDFDCDEAYLQGIARQALRLNYLPPLESLAYGDLLIVLRAIKIEVTRLKRRDAEVQLPVPDSDNEPF